MKWGKRLQYFEYFVYLLLIRIGHGELFYKPVVTMEHLTQ